MTLSEKKKIFSNYLIGVKEIKRFEKEYAAVNCFIGKSEDVENEKIRLCKRVSALLKDKRNIEEKIDSLDDATQAILLRYRYIDGYTWEEICDLLDYSPRSVHYIHNKALERIAM